MVSLIPRPPLSRAAPLVAGTCSLSEMSVGPITSLSPWAGKTKALSTALKKAHGMAFPAPNRVTARDGIRAIWSGRDQAFLVGVAPDTSLGAYAALTDQSDGWAVLRLEGQGGEAVLARLIPLDLRLASFAIDHCARSSLQHISALLVRTGAETIEIMVMRSFAMTAWHELQQAMLGVAARG